MVAAGIGSWIFVLKPWKGILNLYGLHIDGGVEIPGKLRCPFFPKFKAG